MVHTKVDVVIIGGGPAGITAGLGIKRRDPAKSVVIIEKQDLGGENVSTGSIPSKTFLYLAKKHAVTPSAYSSVKILQFVRDKIDEVRADYDEIELQTAGIDVLKGEPEFNGRRSLTINDSKVKFKYAVIATGSEARQLSIKGLDAKDVITANDLFSMKKLPKHVIIVGTGRTGIESAQTLAFLGVKVTVINELDKLFPYLNKEIRTLLEDGLAEHGVRVLHGASINKIHNKTAQIYHSSGVLECPFDNVMFAVGRDAVIPSGTKKARVRLKSEGIPTNLKHLTSNHRIFAIGDVASRSHFTHIATDQAYDVVEYICSRRSRYIHRPAPLIPATLYTLPEVATVGLSYREAREAHRKRSLQKIIVPYWKNDRAKTEFATDGMLTVVVKRKTGKIIGAQIAGACAGELIGTFCVAMQHGLTLPQLGSTMLPYPSYQELIHSATREFYDLN